MAALVKASPQDANARFGLGMLEFAGAIERLGQSLYRHGAVAPSSMALAMPILRERGFTVLASEARWL